MEVGLYSRSQKLGHVTELDNNMAGKLHQERF